MRSSQMARGFGAFSVLTLGGVAVLVFHSAAYAQQADPDAKDTQKSTTEQKAEAPAENTAKPAAPQELPPGYAPPPGYGPRGYRNTPPQPPAYGPGYGYHDYDGPPAYPPRYYQPRYYRPAPVRYYPEPIMYRPFFFGVGLGVGGVGLFPEKGYGDSMSRAGMSYNIHFGFGVSPRWSILLAGDGAYSYFDGYNIGQSVWTIGPQVFLTRKLYVRLGLGVAEKSIDVDSSHDYYYGYGYNVATDSGMGWTAALGFEFMQSYHVALGLEAAATYARYHDIDVVTGSRDSGTVGVNFMLNLF